MNHPLLAYGLPGGSGMIVIAILVLVLFGGAKKHDVFVRALRGSIHDLQQAMEHFLNELALHRHWGPPAPSRCRESLTIPLVLFATSIVLLMVCFIARSH